jgi:hypothetical protein
MSKSKYSIIKGKTGRTKKEIVMGVKKVCYKKKGSTAIYVLSKGKHIRLSVYKKRKMKMKGGASQDGGAKKRKRRRKRKYGGIGDMLEKIMGDNQEGGRKRKRKRRTKK